MAEIFLEKLFEHNNWANTQIIQACYTATEHREQINSMMSALGVTPPDLDGWGYGEAANALVPIST